MKKFVSSLLCIIMISMSVTVNALPVLVEDVLERPTDHRPVPTEFTKSKDLNDLHFFPMPEDGDKIYESLSGGEVVIGGDDLFYEGATIEGKSHGKIEVVDVEGMPFKKALRMTTDTLPSTHSGYNYRIYPDDFEKFTKFEDGDQLLAAFYVRMISGGDRDTNLSSIYAYFCEKSWVKSNDGRQYQTIEFGSDWKRAYVPINLNHEYGEAGFVFSLNPIYYTGVIEVGGLEMVNYGKKYGPDDMPQNQSRYEGCEEDAQWRKDAMARIEQIRKGDVEITVKDENGNPISDADISVDMYEHEFPFSVAIGKEIASNEKYRRALVENFNALGTEGLFHKWVENDDENTYYDYAEGAIDFTERNNITRGIHGHALMYDGAENDRWMGGYKSVYNDKEASLKAIEDNFKYMAERFPEVTWWDVSNEDAARYDNGKGITNTFKRLHGLDMVNYWYEWANKYFPQATLSVAEGYGPIGAFEGAEKPFIEYLLKENVDFDTISYQGHVGYGTKPKDLIWYIEQLSEFDKEILVTEFDTKGIGTDVNYQGNIARDALIAYFSMPQVSMIQLWGFQNASTTKLDHRFVCYYDMSLKPGGVVYQDLVYNKWWTREKGKTNSDGKYTLRAYYGDYDISITHNGVTKVVSVPLYKGYDNKVEITLSSNNTINAEVLKNNNSIHIVKEYIEGQQNPYYVAAEYKDGKLVNAYHSGDYTEIDRRKYVVLSYEKEFADSELYVYTVSDGVKTELVK